MANSAVVIPFVPRLPTSPDRLVTFSRAEWRVILEVYGRMVAAGEWRDYSLSFANDMACFAVYRRTYDHPLFRIEKWPELARRQGAFLVAAADGRILRRGQALENVLKVFAPKRQQRESAQILPFPGRFRNRR